MFVHPSFEKLCRALEMFVHLYGHTQVPVNFEVPRVEPWPVLTWGVKLGTSLTNIVTKVCDRLIGRPIAEIRDRHGGESWIRASWWRELEWISLFVPKKKIK